MEIITPKQVAARLKLSVRVVTAMLSAREIPGFQIGGQWRVERDRFESWLTELASGSAPVPPAIADGATPDDPIGQPAEEPRDGDGVEAARNPRVLLLTDRVTQAEMHRKFIAALGNAVRAHSPIEGRPLEIDLSAPLPSKVRLYIFNATRPPGGRPVGEHKIQLIMPGQGRDKRGSFDLSCGRIALLAGYAAEDNVFVLWDAGLYPSFAWSRNVQVKAATIIAASAGRIVEQTRNLRPGGGEAVNEVLLACPPERLADALVKRMDITRDRLVRG